MNKIGIVGCGPGAAESITLAGIATIRDAEVLVGAARLLETFAGESRAERIVVGADIACVLDAIAASRENRKTVVLVTGDPGLSSLARPILARFGLEECEIVPGVSSVQVAFARLGLDWLDARIVSAHGRAPAIAPETLAGHETIAVLAGRGEEEVAWITALAEVLGSAYAIFLCEDLTLATERVRRVSIQTLRESLCSPRVIVIFTKNR